MTDIESDINDLSNNSNQFIRLLVDYMNSSSGINSDYNLPLTNNYINSQPLTSEFSRLNRILRTSFMEKPSYKKILSKKGINQLKNIIYDDNKYETKECVISMEEFKNGDKITQLPCNHIFHTKSIETWLKEESSKCPVCRYELDYKEIKNSDNIVIQDVSNNDLSNNQVENNISNSNYNRLFSNMDLLYNPMQSIFRPQRRMLSSQRNFINEIIDIENSYLEDRQLQNALISSFNEDYMENIDDNNDTDDFMDSLIEEEKENFLTSISDSSEDDDYDLYSVN